MVSETFDTRLLYTLLLGAYAVERLLELRIARSNAAWSFTRGGKEFGQDHYPMMVVLHTGFLFGCLAEVWLLQRPFITTVGFPALVLCLLAQGLRWWVITTLGPRWNTRVIVVPGLPRVEGGPFRWLRHPNYLAVVTEGFALPLVHGAWVTATVFTLCNALLLRTRIRVEDAALAPLPTSVPPENTLSEKVLPVKDLSGTRP